MSIYTRTGDKGTTAIFGGKRVSKSSLQVEAYGSIDELTSYLGLIVHKVKSQKSKVYFTTIQKDLYQIMGYLAGAKADLKFLEVRVKDLENEIDRLDKKLPKLTRFILPGGTEFSSRFHILRAVCRRAERAVIRSLNKKTMKQFSNLAILMYLNRLSDFFFTLARFYNQGQDQLA